MEDLSWIYSLKTIAVVGASRDESKPAHYVPRYLKGKGYTIYAVNPQATEILGEKPFKRLRDVPHPDIVLMFRPSEEVEKFLPDILEVHPRVVWMQLGISNAQVRREAETQGIYVVEDKCMMVEHRKLFGG